MLAAIRRLASDGLRDEPDASLVRRFAATPDEAAFAEMVRRHGPTVFGVCRRVLRNAADAEDAFQATFLVLARKCGSVARPELLGNWLYGTAYRTALRAKGRRRGEKADLGAFPAQADKPLIEPAEVRAVLDEEIGRLPDRVRLRFVLCHVLGKTNEEAARLIGVPEGTVLSRLHAARQRLQARLSRRGLAPAALLAALASVPVPPALAEQTLRTVAGPAAN